MRLLLDTQAFLWFDAMPAKLSRVARRRLADQKNDLYLSVASIWEMAIKIRLGKLRIAASLESIIDEQTSLAGLRILDVKRRHAEAVQDLPLHHGDPFDRLLVAQAMTEDLSIVSADEQLEAYAVERIW